MPFQIDDDVMPERERLQSPEDRARYDDTTKCILCAACTTSCPSFWAKPEYVGPAAIVNAHRFIFDTRDEGADERLEILADENGVWRCRTIFNCTDACPRGINITRAILEVSTSVLDRRRTARSRAARSTRRHPARRGTCRSEQGRRHRRPPNRCGSGRRQGRRGDTFLSRGAHLTVRT